MPMVRVSNGGTTPTLVSAAYQAAGTTTNLTISTTATYVLVTYAHSGTSSVSGNVWSIISGTISELRNTGYSVPTVTVSGTTLTIYNSGNYEYVLVQV